MRSVVECSDWGSCKPHLRHCLVSLSNTCYHLMICVLNRFHLWFNIGLVYNKTEFFWLGGKASIQENKTNLYTKAWIDSDEPVQPPFKLRNSKLYLVSSSKFIIDIQANSKISDQNAHMRRLIWSFACHTYHIVRNVMSQLISSINFLIILIIWRRVWEWNNAMQ